MSNNVRVRYRNHLPGAGFDANGQPVANKVEVNGRIEVTSYTVGENLPPNKLGLDTIDFISLNMAEGLGDAVRVVTYSASAAQFYVFENNVDTAVLGDSFSVMFNAVGTASTAPELL